MTRVLPRRRAANYCTTFSIYFTGAFHRLPPVGPHNSAMIFPLERVLDYSKRDLTYYKEL
jgi:hypothetical protein